MTVPEPHFQGMGVMPDAMRAAQLGVHKALVRSNDSMNFPFYRKSTNLHSVLDYSLECPH